MYPHIHIGVLELSTWRITVLAGVLFCWLLFLPRAKRLGYPTRQVLLLLALALPVGTIGGHLFNLLIPLVLGTGGWSSARGITVIGSIISVLAFGALYLRYVLRTDPLQFLDAVAFTFPLSIMIGRVGCLLSGCCFGRPFQDMVQGMLVSLFAFPVRWYDASSQAGESLQAVSPDSLVWNLPLFLVLNALFVLITTEVLYRNRERWRLRPGTVIAAAATQYAGGRFFLEFLRYDVAVGNSRFNPWQLAIAALFVLSAVWLFLTVLGRPRGQSKNIRHEDMTPGGSA